ncbi:MAG: hypothetical protein NC189_00125 [Bacteroides sp.]|nr:hypothetical protein [Bacteroides sp.]
MKQRITSLLCSIAALFCLAACSSTDGPSLRSLPASADYVLLADLGSDSATIDRGMLPDGLDNVAPLLQALGKGVNLNSTLCYKPAAARQPIAAFTITDAGELTAALKESGWSKKKINGTEAWEPEGSREFSPCMIIDGNGAWLLATRSDINAWKDSLEEAKSSNFESYGLPGALGEGEIIRAYLNPSGIGLDAKDAMLCITNRPSSEAGKLILTARLLSVPAPSKVLPLDIFAPIDTAAAPFLKLLPSSPALTFAAGIKQSINWGGLIDMFGADMGTQNQGMMQSLLPYINSLNGTLAIGIGPLTPQSLTSNNIEEQTLLLCATFDGEKAREAVEEINRNLRDKGLSPRPRADGVYALSLNGTSYRYTCRGNLFIFALNREIDDSGAGNFSIPAGTGAFARLSLPPLSAVPQPPVVELDFTADQCSLTITAPGQNPMTALTAYFNALRKANREEREASDTYYDDYE